MSEKKIPTAEEVQRLVKTLEGSPDRPADYMVLEWGTFVSLRVSALAPLSAEEIRAHVHEVTGQSHPSPEDAIGYYQTWLNTVFRAQLEEDAKAQHPGLPPDFRLMAVEIQENTIAALPCEVDMEWVDTEWVGMKGAITGRQRADQPHLQRFPPRTELAKELRDVLEATDYGLPPPSLVIVADRVYEPYSGTMRLPESSELLVADYSSLEARVAAQLLPKEAVLAPPPADRKSLRSVAALLTGMALGVDLEAPKPAREERGRREQVEFLLSSLSTETLQQLRDLKNLIRTAPNRRARRIAEALARKADRQLRPLEVTLDEAMEVV